MPADMDILFYILVPVYKVEKYIHECIASVLNQTYQNFKLVLVDDGTPDASGKICDEYAEKDDRIHVIHQKNMGLIAARDTAVNYIRTARALKNAHVVFLDSDDSLKPKALERLTEIIQHKKCDMVIYGMDRVAGGQIVQPFSKDNTESFMEEDKRSLYKRVFLSAQYNPVCRKAIKAELIPEKNYREYYSFSLAEDLLRSIDLYKAVSNVYFLQESLYNYTINPNSITQTVDASNYKVDFTIREQVLDFLQKEDVFTETDWDEYRGFCASLLVNAATTIGCFTIDYTKKMTFYHKIEASDFYRKYLRGKKLRCSVKTRILYRLFEMKAYWIFDAYGHFRNRCKNMRKMM